MATSSIIENDVIHLKMSCTVVANDVFFSTAVGIEQIKSDEFTRRGHDDRHSSGKRADTQLIRGHICRWQGHQLQIRELQCSVVKLWRRRVFELLAVTARKSVQERQRLPTASA